MSTLPPVASLLPLTSLSIAAQPLLHAVIFFIEMAIVARLTSRYNAYYNERPGKMPDKTGRPLSCLPADGDCP
jgi:hypothetical protein